MSEDVKDKAAVQVMVGNVAKVLGDAVEVVVGAMGGAMVTFRAVLLETAREYVGGGKLTPEQFADAVRATYPKPLKGYTWDRMAQAHKLGRLTAEGDGIYLRYFQLCNVTREWKRAVMNHGDKLPKVLLKDGATWAAVCRGGAPRKRAQKILTGPDSKAPENPETPETPDEWAGLSFRVIGKLFPLAEAAYVAIVACGEDLPTTNATHGAVEALRRGYVDLIRSSGCATVKDAEERAEAAMRARIGGEVPPVVDAAPKVRRAARKVAKMAETLTAM